MTTTPRKSSQRRRVKTLVLCCEPDLLAYVERTAEQGGVSKAHVIRKAIELHRKVLGDVAA